MSKENDRPIPMIPVQWCYCMMIAMVLPYQTANGKERYMMPESPAIYLVIVKVMPEKARKKTMKCLSTVQ